MTPATKANCVEETSLLDLPRTVLPACSAWRISEICTDFARWEQNFAFEDPDASGLVPLTSIQNVFRNFLAASNESHLTGDEELRRVLQVIDTDAHINRSDCGACLMHWSDFRALMWGYTTRVLGPAGGAPDRRAMAAEIAGDDGDIYGAAVAAASLPRKQQRAYLLRAPAAKRRRLTAAAMLLMSADDRAALIEVCSLPPPPPFPL